MANFALKAAPSQKVVFKTKHYLYIKVCTKRMYQNGRETES